MFKPRHISKFSIGLLKFLTTPLLAYFTVVGNAMMFTAAYAFYYVERDINTQVDSYSNALWWAICTVSTVGYGDIVPLTGFGKIIGAGLIIFGVMFFLSFSAILAFLMGYFYCGGAEKIQIIVYSLFMNLKKRSLKVLEDKDIMNSVLIRW